MKEKRLCTFCNKEVIHKDSVAQNMRVGKLSQWGFAHTYCMEQSTFTIPRMVLHAILDIGAKTKRRK